MGRREDWVQDRVETAPSQATEVYTGFLISVPAQAKIQGDPLPPVNTATQGEGANVICPSLTGYSCLASLFFWAAQAYITKIHSKFPGVDATAIAQLVLHLAGELSRWTFSLG